MGLYGRNDVMSVAVPLTAGGCGAMHSRPVSDGVAADDWNLESVCVLCSVALRGDPLWAAMPSEIPETPDEKTIREDAEKRGERQIKKSQERLSVQQGELNEKLVELLARGGHAAEPDQGMITRLVAEQVQKALAAMRDADTEQARDLTDSIAVEAELDLTRLHVRTLGKMCNDRGLDRRGSKADLIARLNAVADEPEPAPDED
jgi:hypothetical protein